MSNDSNFGEETNIAEYHLLSLDRAGASLLLASLAKRLDRKYAPDLSTSLSNQVRFLDEDKLPQNGLLGETLDLKPREDSSQLARVSALSGMGLDEIDIEQYRDSGSVLYIVANPFRIHPQIIKDDLSAEIHLLVKNNWTAESAFRAVLRTLCKFSNDAEMREALPTLDDHLSGYDDNNHEEIIASVCTQLETHFASAEQRKLLTELICNNRNVGLVLTHADMASKAGMQLGDQLLKDRPTKWEHLLVSGRPSHFFKWDADEKKQDLSKREGPWLDSELLSQISATIDGLIEERQPPMITHVANPLSVQDSTRLACGKFLFSWLPWIVVACGLLACVEQKWGVELKFEALIEHLGGGYKRYFDLKTDALNSSKQNTIVWWARNLVVSAPLVFVCLIVRCYARNRIFGLFANIEDKGQRKYQPHWSPGTRLLNLGWLHRQGGPKFWQLSAEANPGTMVLGPDIRVICALAVSVALITTYFVPPLKEIAERFDVNSVLIFICIYLIVIVSPSLFERQKKELS